MLPPPIDLIHWTPVEFLADGADPSHSFSQHDSRCKDNDEVARVLLPIIRPRVGNYDEFLCEPGPQAILTDAGIVLIYNARVTTRNVSGDMTLCIRAVSS